MAVIYSDADIELMVTEILENLLPPLSGYYRGVHSIYHAESCVHSRFWIRCAVKVNSTHIVQIAQYSYISTNILCDLRFSAVKMMFFFRVMTCKIRLYLNKTNCASSDCEIHIHHNIDFSPAGPHLDVLWLVLSYVKL
jgi:hypothetical protein